MEITILAIKNQEVEKCIYNNINILDISTLSTVENFVSSNSQFKLIELSQNDNEKIILIINTNIFIEDFQKKINEVVHEIKNVLTIVISSVLILSKLRTKDLLKTKDALVETSLNDVEIAVQNIVILLNNLKKNQLYKEKVFAVKLKDFIYLTTSELETITMNSKIKLDLAVQVKSNEKRIKTHGIMLNQIIVNLIKNAVYSLEKESIVEKNLKVEIIEKEGSIYFSIEDNGAGIRDVDRDSVFEEGFTTKGDDGSGVGLYLCKKGVIASGGSLELCPDYTDGAKFYFELPLGNS